jgi:hypothetical protein
MSVWALVLTIVKLFTAFWSLVTLAVSAAFIGQYNTYRECLSDRQQVG